MNARQFVQTIDTDATTRLWRNISNDRIGDPYQALFTERLPATHDTHV